MIFDIDATIEQMLQAMKEQVTDNWDKIHGSVSEFLQDHKDRLESLAQQRINDEIDDDFLKKRLADETDILKAELIAEKIISKSIAQQAINAALDVLTSAIKAAIHTF